MDEPLLNIDLNMSLDVAKLGGHEIVNLVVADLSAIQITVNL